MTLLAILFGVLLDGGNRSGKELLDDSEFLTECLGFGIILDSLVMVIKLLFRRRS